MADEFESSGICSSGNWWNNNTSGIRKSSPSCCSTSALTTFGWPTTTTTTSSTQHDQMLLMMNNNNNNNHATKSSSPSRDHGASVNSSVSPESSSSIVFHESHHAPQHPPPRSSDDSVGDNQQQGGAIFMDSSLQMMSSGFDLSSPSTDWTQLASLNRNTGRANTNFQSLLQDDLSSRSNFQQEPRLETDQVFQKDWNTKNFLSCNEDSSTSNAFKHINQQVFGLDQQQFDSVPYGCGSSTLLQGLFEPDHQIQQHSFENSTMNYEYPKQPANQLQFSNDTPFWNPSATSTSNIKSNLFTTPQTEFMGIQHQTAVSEDPICTSKYSLKPKAEVRESTTVAKKNSGEPTFKRPRIETPSPLPTFKVRKEKLGDRITALQQLVSPFGKTDTASVLFEAIEYIKFLHEQVTVLSNPYMKNGSQMQQYQQNCDNSKGGAGLKEDLRSRGLCLVPISSTFPVTNETTTDFWTPTFGGTYR